MGPNSSEDDRFFFEVKGKTIFHRYGSFPPILDPLDFFYPE